MGPRTLEQIAESLFDCLTSGYLETENYISAMMDCLEEAHQLGFDQGQLQAMDEVTTHE